MFSYMISSYYFLQIFMDISFTTNRTCISSFLVVYNLVIFLKKYSQIMFQTLKRAMSSYYKYSTWLTLLCSF